MVIVEDTRNQITKHHAKRKWFTEHGIECIRSKLYCGDYALLHNQTLCIDTKKDWLEVASNICGKQHERFRNECLRANNAGIRLIILVEEECPVIEWKCPTNRKGITLSKVNPQILEKAMRTMSKRYNITFIHCDKKHTAEVIYKILSEVYYGNN